jgi:hypothetical protein
MLKAAVLLLAVPLFGAEKDPWSKVRDLKSGTEIRIIKKGAKQPILAKMDEANDERLLAATKTEQISVPREDIDRLDFRPPQTGSRVRGETRTTSGPTEIDTRPRPQGGPSPSQSTSTTTTIGSKPDFETLYRRPPGK